MASFDLCNVLVIIPVGNEEAMIPGVIQDLQNLDLTKIRLLDNSSSDRNRSII
ncbi:MAG: hypothetical protein RLZZ574_2362 [Cyanobacteriota bacterium]